MSIVQPLCWRRTTKFLKSPFHHFLCPRALAGFEPSIFWFCVDCSTTVLTKHKKYSLIWLNPRFFSFPGHWQDLNPQSYDFVLIALPLCKQSTTKLSHKSLLPLFSVLWPFAGFEPSILWFCVDCLTTVLMNHTKTFRQVTFHATFFPRAIGRIWTLDLTILCQLFNHCANEA